MLKASGQHAVGIGFGRGGEFGSGGRSFWLRRMQNDGLYWRKENQIFDDQSSIINPSFQWRGAVFGAGFGITKH